MAAKLTSIIYLTTSGRPLPLLTTLSINHCSMSSCQNVSQVPKFEEEKRLKNTGFSVHPSPKDLISSRRFCMRGPRCLCASWTPRLPSSRKKLAKLYRMMRSNFLWRYLIATYGLSNSGKQERISLVRTIVMVWSTERLRYSLSWPKSDEWC